MKPITIAGIPPSKKNSRNIFKRAGKMYNFPNKKYREWWTDAGLEVIAQKPPHYVTPVKLEVIFKHKYKRKWDLDNKLASVLDLLKDIRVIQDDSWKEVPEIHIAYEQAKVNETIINIIEL